MITRVALSVSLGATKLEGLLGGIGPLASIAFVAENGHEEIVGIDLDKGVLLGDPPVDLADTLIERISTLMNDRRRRLLFETASSAPPSR